GGPALELHAIDRAVGAAAVLTGKAVDQHRPRVLLRVAHDGEETLHSFPGRRRSLFRPPPRRGDLHELDAVFGAERLLPRHRPCTRLSRLTRGSPRRTATVVYTAFQPRPVLLYAAVEHIRHHHAKIAEVRPLDHLVLVRIPHQDPGKPNRQNDAYQPQHREA